MEKLIEEVIKAFKDWIFELDEIELIEAREDIVDVVRRALTNLFLASLRTGYRQAVKDKIKDGDKLDDYVEACVEAALDQQREELRENIKKLPFR